LPLIIVNIIVITASLLCSGFVRGAEVLDGNKLVGVQLVCDYDTLRPGRTALLGVRLEMEPGWHTYWRSPGDSGLPIKVTFEAIEGVTFGEIQWPTPAWHLGAGNILDYVYSGEVMLLVPITVSVTHPVGSPVSVQSKVEWLVCNDVCLPGSADASLTLSIEDASVRSAAAPSIRRALETMPEQIGSGFSTPDVQLEWAGAVLIVRCPGADAVTLFIDYSEETSTQGLPTLQSKKQDTLRIPFDPAPDQFLTLTGVITVDRERERKSYEFEITGPTIR
jgi:thiol:disulfide interchange protein DsbD